MSALVAGAVCTGTMSPADGADVSMAYEPPAHWQSAVVFQFMDSTFRFAEPEVNTPPIYGARVEFPDGRNERVVIGRDVFHAENGAVRTPWYRVYPATGGHAASLRITIGDAAGVQTTADYPMILRRGEFYFIEFGVYTRQYGPGSHDAFMHGWRSYPVPRVHGEVPEIPLWVAYKSLGRDCFDLIVPAEPERGR